MTKAEFSLFKDYYEYPQEEMKKRSAEFYAEMKQRRPVRQFSNRPAHLILMKNLDNFPDCENNKEGVSPIKNTVFLYRVF